MVTVDFYQKLLRSLEMVLLQEKEYRLDGQGYNLILFNPIDASFGGRNALFISAKPLDDRRERQVIELIFTKLKSILSFNEFSTISSLKIINSNSFLVKNINFAFPFQQKSDVEYVINSEIGGITLQGAKLMRSSVLSNLILGKKVGIKLVTNHVLAGRLAGIESDYTVSVEQGPAGRLKRCQFSDIVSVHSYVESL